MSCEVKWSLQSKVSDSDDDTVIPNNFSLNSKLTWIGEKIRIMTKIQLTADLASACLAFFKRALQMSRSSRRFSRIRRSFCGEAGVPYGQKTCWACKGKWMMVTVALTDIVLQSPSRKLRKGARKVVAEVWRNSRSAVPSLFWYSPTVIRVLPRVGGECKQTRIMFRWRRMINQCATFWSVDCPIHDV